ncbi:MAG: DUF3800 domain-containing protein [Planctomycetes bacterium]|nr:DUF3800 domain-containing protein [Planctomycetota bacterium]
MPHCFHVYIDESGDEGFRFAEGSSDWLVVSGVVTRHENDLATVKLVEEVRAVLKKPGKPLHFRDLKHEHRLPYVDRIGNARLRTITVLVHKPSIQEPEKFHREPYHLYRYATRLLLERVSWFCREKRKPEHAHHTARLIFSNRSSMSYDDLRDYLRTLKSGVIPDVRIDWSALDCDEILALPHHAMMGLQIADAVASSMWMGVNRSHLGYVEPRYAQMLANVVYRHHAVAQGYGVKFFPKDAKALIAQFAELAWIEPTYAPRPSRA